MEMVFYAAIDKVGNRAFSVFLGIGRDVEGALGICCLECYLCCIVVVAIVNQFLGFCNKGFEGAFVGLCSACEVDNNLVAGLRCNLVALEAVHGLLLADCCGCAVYCHGCLGKACALNVAGLSLVVGDGYLACLVALPLDIHCEVAHCFEALDVSLAPLCGEGGENVDNLGVALQQHFVDT